VIEVCNIAGWVCDLLRGLGVEVQVANTSEDAWRWRKVKKKNDRADALKAAQLSAVNQLREVYILLIAVRQWRALIHLPATPGRSVHEDQESPWAHHEEGIGLVRSLLVEVAWAGSVITLGCAKPTRVVAGKRAGRLPSWR